MSTLEQYQNKYENLRISRQDGILEVVLHTKGKSLAWSATAHRELGEAFREIATDAENRVMLLTGTGESFCADADAASFAESLATPAGWAKVYGEGRNLYESLLDIPIPIVGVVNGPARAHAALAVLSDIVIASETATFADGHFNENGIVPGDGVQVIWPLLLGANRGRYFLLTDEELDAATALQLGVVAEVLPADKVLDRGRELARQLNTRSSFTLRGTRVAISLELRRLLHQGLGYGLALEVVGAVVGGE